MSETQDATPLEQKVAREICTRSGLDPDTARLTDPPQPLWGDFLPIARAVIAIIRNHEEA